MNPPSLDELKSNRNTIVESISQVVKLTSVLNLNELNFQESLVVFVEKYHPSLASDIKKLSKKLTFLATYNQNVEKNIEIMSNDSLKLDIDGCFQYYFQLKCFIDDMASLAQTSKCELVNKELKKLRDSADFVRQHLFNEKYQNKVQLRSKVAVCLQDTMVLYSAIDNIANGTNAKGEFVITSGEYLEKILPDHDIVWGFSSLVIEIRCYLERLLEEFDKKFKDIMKVDESMFAAVLSYPNRYILSLLLSLFFILLMLVWTTSVFEQYFIKNIQEVPFDVKINTTMVFDSLRVALKDEPMTFKCVQNNETLMAQCYYLKSDEASVYNIFLFIGFYALVFVAIVTGVKEVLNYLKTKSSL